jgi:hypothetical protein
MELKLANEFDSPSGILELWKGFRKEVIELLQNVSEESLCFRPEGRWSLSEVAEHLYLSQLNVARPVPIVLAGKFGQDTDEQPDLQYQKIRDTFYKPTGVKNPTAVAPLNNYKFSELLPFLQKSEKKLEDALKGKTKTELQKRGMPHPILGVLNLFNFIWVMALHEHSHLVAIRERVKK